jgi:alpha-tubulin suppressor-like RCC1 family protein
MGFISNMVAVAGGGGAPPLGYSIAADSKGVVWTWGYNYYGELGNGSDGTGNNQVAPSPITGVSNIVSVAAGMAHTLALRADETVWAWGQDGVGQLGVGGANFDHTNSPVQSMGLTQIVAIAAGGNYSVALDQNGMVWTWGQNDSGQLGNGGTVNTNLPTRVPGISNVIAIAGGWRHTIALKSDKKVWTWGYNDHGELGLGAGAPNSTNVPTLVPTISDIVSIAGGDSFTLAVKSNGQVYAWGWNSSGQLGASTGTVAQTNSPMAVAGISNAVLVSAPPQETGRHSLAVTIEQGVNQYWAWGNSYYGQVGTGLSDVTHWVTNGPDEELVHNDSNIYAPAGPLEFQPGCDQSIQLGTNGSFTAQCTGTLFLYLNDYHGEFGDNATNSFSVTIDNGLGTTNVPGNAENGVAIGTVSNGVTYTYSATGLCYHCAPGGVPDCPTDPNGKKTNGILWDCSSRSPCTLVCPECQCFSLVGKIK